jgi:hypothetical protein
LSHSACREILLDFADTHGRNLSDVLTDSGRPAGEAFALLRFYDDRLALACLKVHALEFAAAGSRLIHICGRSSADACVKNPAHVELIVIHEFRHTLGLGENPPTSAAITGQVLARWPDAADSASLRP